MPNINIIEIDNTTTGAAGLSSETVYIPGFAATKPAFGYNVPTLFTSISDFEASCGKSPVALTKNTYEDLKTFLGTYTAEGQNYSSDYPINDDNKSTKIAEQDMSYVYAKECLAAGLNVLYEVIDPTEPTAETESGTEAEGTASLLAMYKFLIDKLTINGQEYALLDRGTYDIKYLTTGGYPVFDIINTKVITENETEKTRIIVDHMVRLCEERGDCYAVFDYFNFADRKIYGDTTSLFDSIQGEANFSDGVYSYGALFAPWKNYKRTTYDKDNTLNTYAKSAGFAYLTTLGESVKTNASWLAVAGVTRGAVRHIASPDINVIPNGAADKMQKREETVSINTITQINPYGETIWGNRTLHKTEKTGLVATSFLNVRNLLCDIKKELYKTAKRLTYEPNTSLLWTKFKGLVTPLLDKMQSGYGISGYNLKLDPTHIRAKEKGVVCAKLIIYPVYPVEDFEISVIIEDDEVTIV